MKINSSYNIEITRFPFANPVNKKDYSTDEKDFKKIQPIKGLFKTTSPRDCTKRTIDIMV